VRETRLRGDDGAFVVLTTPPLATWTEGPAECAADADTAWSSGGIDERTSGASVNDALRDHFEGMGTQRLLI
jgi:hypothetical protein